MAIVRGWAGRRRPWSPALHGPDFGELCGIDLGRETIAATTTRSGLRVHAELDTGSYPTGISISDEQVARVPLTSHDWHGDWNYTVHPTPGKSAGSDTADDHTPTIAQRPDLSRQRTAALTVTGPRLWVHRLCEL